VAPALVASRDAAWLGRQLGAGWRPALYRPWAGGRWHSTSRPPATLATLLLLLATAGWAMLCAEERYLAACE
jgi:hypothetical protein